MLLLMIHKDKTPLPKFFKNFEATVILTFFS